MKKLISAVLMVAILILFFIPVTTWAYDLSATAKIIDSLKLTERQAEKAEEQGLFAVMGETPQLRLKITDAEYRKADTDTNIFEITLKLENAEWINGSAQTFADMIDIVFDSSEVGYTVTESNVEEDKATISLDFGENHLVEDDIITITLDTLLTRTYYGTEAKVSVDSDDLGINVDGLVFCSVSVPALTYGELCQLLVKELGLNDIDTNEWENPFDYITETDPYYKDMLIAYYMDWIGRRVESSDIVNRLDMAEILYAAEQGGESAPISPSDIEENDSDYAIVCAVLGSGVMSLDENGEFDRYADAYATDINCDKLKAYDVPESSLVLDLSNGSIEIESTVAYVKYIQNDATYYNTGNILVNQSSAKTKNTILVDGISEYAKPVNLSIANLYIETDAIRPLWFGKYHDTTTVNLTLVGESTINTSSNYWDSPACLYNDGILNISGSGTLNAISSNHADAIYLYGITTINSGTIIANASNGYAIYCRNSFTINDGTVIAEGNSTGIRGRNDGIVINDGAVTVTGREYGIESDVLTINGGIVTVSSKDEYEGAGIGGKNSVVTINNGNVTITGGFHAIGGNCGDYCRNKPGCEAITISSEANVTLTYTNENGSPCCEIIHIEDQPLSSAALLGNSAAISVAAHGNSGLSYEWESSPDGEEWTAINGQTTATLTTPVTAETTSWYYRCKLTNGWGNCIYTNAAQAFVLDFAQQPRKQDTGLEDLAAISVKASCEDVAYQWQSSADGGTTWEDMKSGNASVITIDLTSADENILYRCVLTATNGNQLISDTVTLVNAKDITYTIKYYLENADGSGYYTTVNQETIVAIEGEAVSIPEKSFEHFIEVENKGIITGTVLADSSLELTRYYDRMEYTITFDTNGGSSLPVLTAKYDANITLLQPTKYGMEFIGWYIDADGIDAFTSTKMPGGNIVLYAKWNIMGADRGLEYQFNSIRITTSESDYNDLDEIPVGTFYAEVSVTNKASKYMDTLMLASYDADGRMISLQYMSATSAVGQTVVFGSTIDNSDGNITTIKAFMVPLLNGLVPLAKTIAFGSI